MAAERPRTVDDLLDALRERLEIEGARLSYRQNCASMQRVHISPALGSLEAPSVTPADVERLVRRMLQRGLAPKTIRNVTTFLHSAFALGLERGWCMTNPVTRAARPKRRRSDASPDLRFLSVEQIEAVLAALPDGVVARAPSRRRRGRAGPAPPVPPDALGPVLRAIVLTAAYTGLRQSELLGLRWRDVDWPAQRVRVRNAYVRGEHSREGKSDLSTRRSVPIADRLRDGLRAWRERSVYVDDDDLRLRPSRSSALRSIGRRSLDDSSKAAATRTCRSSPSTTCGTPLRRGSRLPAFRSVRSRSSSATPT